QIAITDYTRRTARKSAHDGGHLIQPPASERNPHVSTPRADQGRRTELHRTGLPPRPEIPRAESGNRPARHLLRRRRLADDVPGTRRQDSQVRQPGRHRVLVLAEEQLFCGTCGQLALPGVHPDPACNRHQPAPGGTPTATITGMTEVNPDQAATLTHYAVQAADGEAQLNPPPDGETPGDYTRRLITA